MDQDPNTEGRSLHGTHQHCRRKHKFTRKDIRRLIIVFLDCAVHIEGDGSLNIKFYRKPTHIDQCLLFHSHHPLEHKLSVIRTLHHWAQNIPTRTEGKEEEQKHIKTALKTCGYPGWSLIKSSRKPRGEQHSNSICCRAF